MPPVCLMLRPSPVLLHGAFLAFSVHPLSVILLVCFRSAIFSSPRLTPNTRPIEWKVLHGPSQGVWNAPSSRLAPSLVVAIWAEFGEMRTLWTEAPDA